MLDKDVVPAGPHAWIQWKGTNVCMDVRCQCGKLTHVDAEFCYYLECGACGAKYSVGSHISLHPLTADEAVIVSGAAGIGFIKSDV